MSAISPQSVACIPIAVITSVTISEAVPKSVQPIWANLRTLGKPAIDSWADQPAILIYFTILLSLSFLSQFLGHYSHYLMSVHE